MFKIIFVLVLLCGVNSWSQETELGTEPVMAQFAMENDGTKYSEEELSQIGEKLLREKCLDGTLGNFTLIDEGISESGRLIYLKAVGLCTLK
jgi:hypothetical protein